MGKESFKVLTLNNISVRGLERLPRERYEVASEIGHPDAILLRSADMHEMDVPASVRAVARAGALTRRLRRLAHCRGRNDAVPSAGVRCEHGQHDQLLVRHL